MRWAPSKRQKPGALTCPSQDRKGVPVIPHISVRRRSGRRPFAGPLPMSQSRLRPGILRRVEDGVRGVRERESVQAGSCAKY